MQDFKQLKPAMSLDGQIQHLTEHHGLIISDPQVAKDILAKVNYYRLSGYGIGLLDKYTDRYISGTTIEDIYALYQFDAELRNALSRIIECVEIRFRTAISYQLAMKYGAECYCDRNNFTPWISGVTGKDMFDAFQEHVSAAIRQQSKKPFVKHHIQIYGGHFPIWVIVEIISLGSLSTLYSLMKRSDQNEVARQFGTKYVYMKSWFAAFVELRNICAHYGRLYNMPLDSTAKLPPNTGYANSKLFTDCMALRYIMCNTPEWSDFIKRLKDAIDSCPEVNLSFIGFPREWKQLLM